MVQVIIFTHAHTHTYTHIHSERDNRQVQLEWIAHMCSSSLFQFEGCSTCEPCYCNSQGAGEGKCVCICVPNAQFDNHFLLSLLMLHKVRTFQQVCILNIACYLFLKQGAKLKVLCTFLKVKKCHTCHMYCCAGCTWQ